MNILITGANSFIGRNFIFFTRENNIVNEICLQHNSVRNIDFYKYEIVIHVAAIVHQNKDISYIEYKKINTDLAFDVAKRAKKQGVQQFVFMSTVKVYGESNNDGPWTEVSPCNPVDSYGKSKYEAEKRLLELQDEHFIVSIIRSPVVYGPGVKGNILKLIKMVDRIPILPLGGIKNKRAMVYIRNLIALINRIIEKKAGGIYLAGDSEQISTTRLVKEISVQLNKKNVILKIPAFILVVFKKIMPSYYIRLWGNLLIDPEDSFNRLDFTPPYTIKEGIAETIHWYKKAFK